MLRARLQMFDTLMERMGDVWTQTETPTMMLETSAGRLPIRSSRTDVCITRADIWPESDTDEELESSPHAASTPTATAFQTTGLLAPDAQAIRQPLDPADQPPYVDNTPQSEYTDS